MNEYMYPRTWTGTGEDELLVTPPAKRLGFDVIRDFRLRLLFPSRMNKPRGADFFFFTAWEMKPSCDGKILGNWSVLLHRKAPSGCTVSSRG